MFKKTFKPIINPYIVNTPVKTEALFFGRENDFKIIQNWIMRGSSQVILLAGGRATGKTSILYQMQNGKLAEVGETIFCDFQALISHITKDDDLPFEIGKFILENEHFKKFSPDFLAENDVSPTLRLQNLVEQCLEEISPRKLILLCDEFASIETCFAQGYLSSEALSWVKKLLTRSVYFIMTGDHELKSESMNTAFGNTLRKRLIQDLTQQDALMLIKKPVEDSLTYKSNVPQMIYRLSGGHPFYTQYLCHALVNYANLELKRNYVVLKDVNYVVDTMVRNPSDYLLEVWQSHWELEGAPETTKSVLAALANTLRKPNDYASNSSIYKTAKKNRFAIEEKTLFETLAWLKHKTHLLDWQTKGYRFRMDLLRCWIAHTFQTVEDIDLWDVKTEVTAHKKSNLVEEIPEATLEDNAPLDGLLSTRPEPLLAEREEMPISEDTEEIADVTQKMAETSSMETFSKEEAYAEKLETLLQDEATTAEEKEMLGDLVKEETYNNYIKELETQLQIGDITLKERKMLDQFLEKEQLDFEQALVAENRLRASLKLDFLDWKQEYELSCQALKTQYAQQVPKTALKDLYGTYVALKRISKQEAKTIAQSFGLPLGIDTLVKEWLSRTFEKTKKLTTNVDSNNEKIAETTETPLSEPVTEDISPAQYTTYAEQVETFLQDGMMTARERAELDNVITDYKLGHSQANLVENQVRKKLGLKPLDWTQEYRSNCYTLKERYPHRTPRKELKNLNLYVSPERITREKADEIAKYIGLQAELQGFYSWVAIAIGAVAIAVLVLSQLLPLLTPLERVKPEGKVNGLQTSYREGDEIVYTLYGSDNEALQRLQFSVSDTKVQENWQVSGKIVTKEVSISTKDWEANRPYTYYYTVADQAGNEYRSSGTFRLEESVPPTVEISGIAEKYTAGDTILYAITVEDNLALKNMVFTVSSQLPEKTEKVAEEIPAEEMRPVETPEELADKAKRHHKEWDIRDLQSSKQSSSFSTEGWQAGNYTYTLQVNDKMGNQTIQQSQFTLLAKSITDSTSTNNPTEDNNSIEETIVTVTPISNSEMSQLLQQCAEHFDANRLTTGQGGTALNCYQQVLSRDANNALAKAGLQKIENKYVRWAEIAISSRQTGKASNLLERLRQVNPNSTALSRLEAGLAQLQKTTSRGQTSDRRDNDTQSNRSPSRPRSSSSNNTQPKPPRKPTTPPRPKPRPTPENQLF